MMLELEFRDLVQGVIPGLLPVSAGGHGQTWAVVGAAQLCGHQENPLAYALKRGPLKLGRQAESLEPVHQVVGQQEEMEVGLVGHEVAGGNAAQGVVSLELYDQQFDPGAVVVVEAPEVQRVQGQIGDQDLVVISAELEERQLIGRLVGLRPSHHDEAIRMGPPGRLVAKLGDLDAPAGTHIPQVCQLALDRSREAGDDHEPGPLRFESLDQRVVVKPFVRADYHQPNPGGNLREACREQNARPTGGMGIARPQLAMPEVLAPALET